MKSTTSVLIAALASTVAAQPHGHAHAHEHLAREHRHQHEHAKRVLETEVVVEWVTETVTELIEGTATTWITPDAAVQQPATTFATVTAPASAAASSSQDAGQFYEGPSSSSTLAVPVETPTTTSTSSTYVAPAAAATTSTSSSIYVAPVEPTTTSTTPVVVIEPTSTSTSAEAAATTETSSSSSGASTGWKITWIGPTVGAYTSCGAIYEADSMYVAVDPSVLPTCGSDGSGTTMSITANGKTISAYAIDKCMGCDPTHIDVATAVYEALGWDTSDGGMHDTGDITWTID